jgi:serine O-acetyltransferase
MKLFLDHDALVDYVSRQLCNCFPCGVESQTRQEIGRAMPKALDRTEYCFSRIKAKYFQQEGVAFFSPLNTDQYAMFLYLLANTVFCELQNQAVADRLYALNKMLHSIDAYYQVALPKVFLFVHSVGTVLGRASYGEGLVVYQGVTVGGNLKYEYPVIGRGAALFSNCSVLGRSDLGDGVMVAARSLLMDVAVPSGHVCFGMHPEVRWKQTQSNVLDRYFINV